MADSGNFNINIEEWPYSPKFQKFADFLGLLPTRDSRGINWRYDKRTADKIEEIYGWGKTTSGSEDIVDIMTTVKTLQKDLGVTVRGKTLVDHLWGWVRLNTQKQRIEKEMDLYQNQPKETPEIKEEDQEKAQE